MNYHLTNTLNNCTGLAAGGSGSCIVSGGMAQWIKRSPVFSGTTAPK